MDVYRGGERIRTYPIVIGSPSFGSPQGAYDIRYIEWNPWWNPPSSGWAKNERVTPPGPGNPMGRAKLEFLPLFYIHGTSGAVSRAVSHGCIRMRNQDVLELARLIVDDTNADISSDHVASLERNSGRTHRIALSTPVRVHIVYRLAEELDGGVRVYDDVYDVGMSATERELALRAKSSGR
jgi:murein L,D-transpeptidase YcbB/YkuD